MNAKKEIRAAFDRCASEVITIIGNLSVRELAALSADAEGSAPPSGRRPSATNSARPKRTYSRPPPAEIEMARLLVYNAVAGYQADHGGKTPAMPDIVTALDGKLDKTRVYECIRALTVGGKIVTEGTRGSMHYRVKGDAA